MFRTRQQCELALQKAKLSAGLEQLLWAAGNPISISLTPLSGICKNTEDLVFFYLTIKTSSVYQDYWGDTVIRS